MVDWILSPTILIFILSFIYPFSFSLSVYKKQIDVFIFCVFLFLSVCVQCVCVMLKLSELRAWNFAKDSETSVKLPAFLSIGITGNQPYFRMLANPQSKLKFTYFHLSILMSETDFSLRLRLYFTAAVFCLWMTRCEEINYMPKNTKKRKSS